MVTYKITASHSRCSVLQTKHYYYCPLGMRLILDFLLRHVSPVLDEVLEAVALPALLLLLHVHLLLPVLVLVSTSGPEEDCLPDVVRNLHLLPHGVTQAQVHLLSLSTGLFFLLLHIQLFSFLL